MKTNEEIRTEWYDILFSYPQLKNISEEDKQTLTDYFDKIDSKAHEIKQQIFDLLETKVFTLDLVWPPDDMIQIWIMIHNVQEAAVAIWIINDKKLPEPEWLINRYYDYWIEKPERMCEPLTTDGSDGKNLHEAMGNVGNRLMNKFANWIVERMKL